MSSKVTKRNKRPIEKAIIDENTDFLDEEFLKGTDLHNRVDEKGYTLLHLAVENSSERMVKYFLDKGFSSQQRMRSGQTSLHLSVQACNYNVVKLLLSRNCPINAKDEFGRTALHLAVDKCSHRKSSSRNRIIHLLLRRGANVNDPTVYGETPFRRAVEWGSEYLVRLFLRYTADVNDMDRNGDNVLHFAVQKSNPKIVEILLDSGAQLDSVNKDGRTALHLAASSAKDKVVDLLIKRGAVVDAKDHSGKTPIFMAVRILYYDNDQAIKRRHQIIRSLLDAGANINHYNDAGEPAFHQALGTGLASIIELFLERGADVYSRNADDQSALHLAVEYAPENILDMLIDRGVPIDERTWNGATPLHIAVQFRKQMHVKSLLGRGADINVTDFDGYTPLHYAARLCYLDKRTMEKIVNLLLDNGADPLVRSNDGRSPLDISVEKSNFVMIKYLLRHLALLEAMGYREAMETAIRGIDTVDKWMQIYEKFQRELANMKEEKINENVSYFEVFSQNSDWTASLVRKKEFVKAFMDNNYLARNFPLYGELAKKKFVDAVNRKELAEKAIVYLFEAFRDVELPLLVVETMVKYYELEDLEKLVKTCQEAE